MPGRSDWREENQLNVQRSGAGEIQSIRAEIERISENDWTDEHELRYKVNDDSMAFLAGADGLNMKHMKDIVETANEAVKTIPDVDEVQPFEETFDDYPDP